MLTHQVQRSGRITADGFQALPVSKENWKQLFIYVCEKDGKEVFLLFDFTVEVYKAIFIFYFLEGCNSPK